jgi:hypothetical protein
LAETQKAIVGLLKELEPRSPTLFECFSGYCERSPGLAAGYVIILHFKEYEFGYLQKSNM